MTIKERITVLQFLDEMVNSIDWDIDYFTNQCEGMEDTIKAKQYIKKQLEKIASAV